MTISPLHRPASKSRLRALALASPAPISSKPHSPSPSVSTRSALDASLARDPVPAPFHPAHTSPLALSPPPLSPADGASLNNSTSSRADTHTAFTFDSWSPGHSEGHLRSPTHMEGHNFEIVSYTDSSPRSERLERGSGMVPVSLAGTRLVPYDEYHDFDDDGESGYDGRDNQYRHGYPTPSTSPSFVAALSGDHQHGDHHGGPTLAPPQHDLYTAQSYPHIAAAASTSNDIFSLTDAQLDKRFTFLDEIGFGNWGRVFLARPRTLDPILAQKCPQISKLGVSSAASGGANGGGLVAIKFVHREATPTTTARVRALWGEMKVIRSLKHEPHPSIIQFEAFVITPSFALVIMPFFPGRIDVPLPLTQAKPYFRQLASAVGYLHERGVTHNDIKPANVLISYNDIPVLVDFGFANRWDMSTPHCFLSNLSWGTPEYLDPQRAMGLPHDERASDVWALGITMYEILVGRTPFEKSEEEAFDTPEEMLMYYERTRRGKWYGDFPMPTEMRHLLKSMICPDPAYRITATQVYHHPALAADAPSVIITPHFVRAAVGESGEALPSVPADYATMLHEANANPAVHSPNRKRHTHKETTVNGEKKKRKKRRSGGPATGTNGKPLSRASAPALALGESIKQHTAVGPSAKNRVKSGVAGVAGVEEENPESPNRERYVIKKTREEGVEDRRAVKGKGKGKAKVPEDDPTPTKVVKPAEPLLTKDSRVNEPLLRPGQPRVSQSHTTSISRPASNASLASKGGRNTLLSTTTRNSQRSSSATHQPTEVRDSVLSTTSIASTTTAAAPKSKAEAVLRTMRSLEGGKGHASGLKRDFVAQIKRPAPPAPGSSTSRPSSVDSALAMCEGGKEKVVEHRKSAVFERVLDDVKEEDRSPVKRFEADEAKDKGKEREEEEKSEESEDRTTGTVKEEDKVKIVGSKPPVVDTLIDMTAAFPRSEEDKSFSGLRDRILSEDKEKLARYRTTSGDLGQIGAQPPSPARRAKESTAPDAIGRHGLGAFDTGSRLDRLAEWVKNVERIVEDARRALAEGRDPPLPDLPLPSDFLSPSGPKPAPDQVPRDETIRRSFGVSPEKAIPAHLRTGSTQVEPSTPPKWLTLADAEERVKAANDWVGEGEKPRMVPIRKERPTVAHVLKLFGADKDKTSSRSNTPEPSLQKPLRGVPSTPALRSFATHRVPARKSESNLRNFNTVPVSSARGIQVVSPPPAGAHDSGTDGEDDHAHAPAGLVSRRNPPSVHRQKVYEQLLDSTPGVSRLGEGWGSTVFLAPPPPIPAASGVGIGGGGKTMAKPSSIASLRERARAVFVGSGGEKEKKDSRLKERERRLTSSTIMTTAAPISNVPGTLRVEEQDPVRPDPFAAYPVGPSKERRNSRASTILMSVGVGREETGRVSRPATPSAGGVLGGIGGAAGGAGKEQPQQPQIQQQQQVTEAGGAASSNSAGKGIGGLFRRFGGKKAARLEKLEEVSP